jgi:DNA polymerase III epsilon subunit family exonuclease
MTINNYVVIDVETTGLKPDQNEIIEIGMVKIEKGKLSTEFQSFIKPQKAISYTITKLTGITNKDLKDAPFFIDIVDDILSFIGDATIVGHNVMFDYSMLQSALKRIQHPPLNLPLVDTIDVFSILKPTFPSYKLSDVSKNFLKIDTNFHRALEDAKVTGELLLASISGIKKLDKNIINQILILLKGTKTPLFEIFNNNSIDESQGIDTILKTIFIKVSKPPHLLTKKEQKETKPIINNITKSTDLFVKTFDRSESYIQIINDLIPWAMDQKKHIVFAVNDINNKSLLKKIDNSQNITILKDNSDYICLKRFNSLKKHLISNNNTNSNILFAPLLTWINITTSGDFHELHKKVSNENKQKICIDNKSCTHNKCTFYKFCFVEKTKESLKNSNVILTGHKTLNTLNDIDCGIIFDAHKTEKEITKKHKSYSENKIARGLSHIDKILAQDKSSEIKDLETIISDIKSNTHLLFKTLSSLDHHVDKKHIIHNKIILNDISNTSIWTEIIYIVQNITKRSEKAITHTSFYLDKNNSHSMDITSIRKLHSILNNLLFFLNNAFNIENINSDNISWIQFHKYNDKNYSTIFVYEPKDQNINDKALNSIKTKIMVSPIDAINYAKSSINKDSIIEEFPSKTPSHTLFNLTHNNNDNKNIKTLNITLIKDYIDKFKGNKIILLNHASAVTLLKNNLENALIFDSKDQRKNLKRKLRYSNNVTIISTFELLENFPFAPEFINHIFIQEIPFPDIFYPPTIKHKEKLKTDKKRWYKNLALPYINTLFISTILNLLNDQKQNIAIINLSPRFNKFYTKEIQAFFNKKIDVTPETLTKKIAHHLKT